LSGRESGMLVLVIWMCKEGIPNLFLQIQSEHHFSSQFRQEFSLTKATLSAAFKHTESI
jgi:hypothetical protein